MVCQVVTHSYQLSTLAYLSNNLVTYRDSYLLFWGLSKTAVVQLIGGSFKTLLWLVPHENYCLYILCDILWFEL